MPTVNDALECSPFFYSLDDALRDRFRHRLLERLKEKLIISSDTRSLAEVEISTDNACHNGFGCVAFGELWQHT